MTDYWDKVDRQGRLKHRALTMKCPLAPLKRKAWHRPYLVSNLDMTADEIMAQYKTPLDKIADAAGRIAAEHGYYKRLMETDNEQRTEHGANRGDVETGATVPRDR